MAAALPVLAALLPSIIGAVGSIGGAVTGAVGQNKAAKIRPRITTVPLPNYQSAIDRINARAYALNMLQTPPSFTDWVNSGGTAKFPMINPGMNPKETQSLGLVSPTGGPVPFAYGPGGSPSNQLDFGGGADQGLSEMQKLYLGMQLARGGKHGSLGRIAHMENRKGRLTSRLEQHPENANRIQGKIDRTGTREENLLNRFLARHTFTAPGLGE